jgi:hypothetical protein
MVNQTAVTPDLVNAVYHHTRRNERAIGVDFDSEKVLAIYGCLEELTQENAARQIAKVAVISFLQDAQAKMKAMQAESQDIEEVRDFVRSVELAAAILEQLENG